MVVHKFNNESGKYERHINIDKTKVKQIRKFGNTSLKINIEVRSCEQINQCKHREVLKNSNEKDTMKS